MRILFDQGTPVPLRTLLSDHEVENSYDRGWATLSNGDLLTAAEAEGFDIFVTTDQNLRYQLNLSERSLAIIVLLSTSWPRIQNHIAEITGAIESATAGSYVEIAIS